MVTFTAFFTSENPAKVKQYLHYMRWGRRALELIMPDARYVVLTDKETAPLLEPHIEIAVTAPSDTPHMLQCILAQAEFEARCTDDLSIIAAPDCIVSRSDLPQSICHPFVVTYRRGGTINNVGYAIDHELAHWFLMRAANALDALPRDQVIWIGSAFRNVHDWGGDQEGWRLALGEYEKWERVGEKTKIKVATVEDSEVYLYPMSTHNHPIRKTGQPKRGTYEAYLLHFKGRDRKQYIESFVIEHLPHWQEKRERVSNTARRKLEKRQLKAMKCGLL